MLYIKIGTKAIVNNVAAEKMPAYLWWRVEQARQGKDIFLHVNLLTKKQKYTILVSIGG